MIVFSALWVYLGIQSPFLITCFYGPMERFEKIASPFLVVPCTLAVCGYFYLNGLVAGVFYSHFAYAAFFIISCYLACQRFGYTRPQSLVLALLLEIALDELWQTPFNSLNWTYSLSGFEYGIATAGWNLMSLPLIGLNLLRFKRNLEMGSAPKSALFLAVGLTLFEIWRFYIGGYPDNSGPTAYPGIEPYYLVIPWFLFFLLLFRSSRPIVTDVSGVSDGTPERY